MVKGQIISGEFGKIVVRQKHGQNIEIGEMLVCDFYGGKVIYQVFDLRYGSQISPQELELVSGLSLEKDDKLWFMEEELRNYNLAFLKPLVYVTHDKVLLTKSLPSFFSKVREISKDDLRFMEEPENSLYFGKIRSGSKEIDFDVNLDGKEVLPHHILIAGTTGRGKSVLMKNLLWSTVGKGYAGMLVLDPHDEYYGRNKYGMKDHPKSDKVIYYTLNHVPAGCNSLKINIKSIKPNHFAGAMNWSDPQKEMIYAYYRVFRNRWIEAIILDQLIDNQTFNEGTINVVKRRLFNTLNLSVENHQIYSSGAFDTTSGESTVGDILDYLESGQMVIIDTSSLAGNVEILIGSIITSELFNRYKDYKLNGQTDDKPPVAVVLEEAPRVLGKEALENGPNIFSTIAREGRKFRIGIVAITQLPSLIPKTILANMNTKIILGVEMNTERQAIIECASQDLSSDDRAIASLDIGEAIVTSKFSKFALPIKIPFFDEVVKKTQNEFIKMKFSDSGKKIQNSFAGVNKEEL